MVTGKFTVAGNVTTNEGISVEIPRYEIPFGVETFDVEEELKGFERGFLASTNPSEGDTYVGHLMVGVVVGSAAYSYEYEYSASTHTLKRVEA